jgi:hypothetical protein
MSKKLVHDYTFIPASNTVVIDGIYRRERFLLITNVTTNQPLYIFNSTTFGLQNYTINTTAETTTLELTLDCSLMTDTDKLQIFVETDHQSFEPSETFVDPVSKIRVSQPENLIDTDFEYGLQSTKWETLELVKNIPTFFSRNGDEELLINFINVTVNSNIITVFCDENHNMIRGNPIIVIGTRVNTCNGAFVVTNVIDDTTFQYKAKSSQGFTGTIQDTYTQLFIGSIYQGTEFKLNNIDSVITDGLSSSTLQVNTLFPNNFEVGTSFFLSNSLAQRRLSLDAQSVEPDNFNDISVTTDNDTATGEIGGFALGRVQPYRYSPAQGFYFTTGDYTVNTSAETITFTTPHGLEDNKPYVYIVGWSNGVIGGLTDFRVYYVRVVDADTIYLTLTRGSTSRVNLTTQGSSYGVVRSCFGRVYRPISVNGTANIETITHDEVIPGIESDGDQILIPVYTTYSNLAVATSSASTNFSNATLYYPKVVYDNGTRLSFTSSPRSGLINFTSGTINGFLMPAVRNADGNSIWFANHGCETNDVIQIQQTVGTLPSGLGNNAVYVVEKLNENRLAFRAENNTTSNVIFGNVGTNTGVYRIYGKVTEINNDSIYIPDHGLGDGTFLTYSAEGNSTIQGLTDGNSYYVFQSSRDRFKLSTSPSGWLDVEKTFAQNTSTVNLGSNFINIANHGFSTGDAVQYLSDNPIGGLRNGAFYWVNIINTTSFYLHFERVGSLTNNAATRVNLAFLFVGTGSFRKASLVDITNVGTGTQRITATGAGASDNVYTISSIVDDRTFNMTTDSEIPLREISIVHNNNIWMEQSSLRIPDHYLVTGQSLTYVNVSGDPLGDLQTDDIVYIIRVSRNWVRLALTYQDAIDNNFITFSSKGSGSSKLTTFSVIGEVLGPGTLTILQDQNSVLGSGTQFASIYSPGDTITAYQPEESSVVVVTSINTTTNVFTSAGHGLSTGDLIQMQAGTPPGGTNNEQLYYSYVIDVNTFTIHNTADDANSNLNAIDVTTTGTSVTVVKYSGMGSTFIKDIVFVNGSTRMVLSDNATEDFIDCEYAVGTTLLVRADGFALHRPYDGGVELIPSTNPDSQMIRQTRKYFRYQSGKGIQVSFAVNFSPTTTIELITRIGQLATITTRNPHRLSQGLTVTIYGATSAGGINYWNGSSPITEIVDDFTFKVQLSGVPAESIADGLPEFYVDGWSGSETRCGLFDDQNGLFFEYDGQNVKVCRRSSIQQISGTVSVEFRSGEVIGTNTRFQSQLSVGDKIVIKGQTYKITNISSNTLLYILPSYRGISSNNVIVTKTIDTKVPQNEWNLDICDGTGPTGFYLDKHRIQMAYMDYSWYGAGKVRFGFKDQRGKVIYVHEFIHNNKFTEAYMRSGNLPARYDIENIGRPSYVPALAHWGTSVIMDGRFDTDQAYVFTASSAQLSITGSAQLTISARAETNQVYYGFQNNQLRTLWYGLLLAAPNPAYNGLLSGLIISGANIPVGTRLRNPQDGRFSPSPYQTSIDSTYFANGTFVTQRAARNLLLIDRQPTGTATGNSNYTLTISTAATPVVYDIPLISIRLSPSVDTNTPGFLGEREIVNRMQLILNSVGILSTHSAEIVLRLNGQLDNNAWERVSNPSLSQLIYHQSDDTIIGGTIVFSFRAQGGTGTTARAPVVTTADLGEVVSLGNSILGGNAAFPDGPDVLTVVARLTEDPSTVSTTNPFTITGRISWSESQA